ncbi:hypothetical protein ADIAG_01767 [Paeniglutamicibacter gangotriensis Lz1y]|uniref:Uncharacterized protein n=1 Tax=Paeniglutamicibacter gangotriensis Lz1y TaxID=1276920 RepID=M7NKD4_9MICC|nr:hypothetical protein ADIAG_01767 [Paeniglutamicibacter gangotriensis Lz1y]
MAAMNWGRPRFPKASDQEVVRWMESSSSGDHAATLCDPKGRGKCGQRGNGALAY